MVFIPPHDPRYFIKRVVGIPGDHVRYENKVLYINGERAGYVLQGRVGGSTRSPVRAYTETIDGRAHTIYKNGGPGKTQEWEVPPGRYLMMGDNRDHSADSRVWGLAHEDNIVGKTVAVWLHKEPGFSMPTFARNHWLPE